MLGAFGFSIMRSRYLQFLSIILITLVPRISLHYLLPQVGKKHASQLYITTISEQCRRRVVFDLYVDLGSPEAAGDY